MKRAAFAALAVLVLGAAVLWLLGRKAPAPAPRATAERVERPRRPKTERPRPPAPEARAAAVVPASVQTASPRVRALEASVLQAAVRHDWVIMDEQGTPCPPQRVRIVYDAPSDLGGYDKGAYFEPLAPPDDRANEVNGLLLCEGSSFFYRGFEAYFRADRGQWEVFPFPVVE